MFNFEENKEKREWFLSNFTEVQKSFLHKKYNEFISIYKIEVDIFIFYGNVFQN